MKIALLVDADNVSANWFPEFVSILEKKGTLLHRRVYGDFSSSYLSLWKERSLRCQFLPIQQFQKTGGNSTDMRLIIDAMDLLYTHPEIDCFCLASGDADYISLITRLKESGKKVIVMGPVLTSSEMRMAADEFHVFLDSDKQKKEETPKKEESTKQEDKKAKPQPKSEDSETPLIDWIEEQESEKNTQEENKEESDLSGEEKEISEDDRKIMLKGMKLVYSLLENYEGWVTRCAFGHKLFKLEKEGVLIIPDSLKSYKLNGLLRIFKSNFEFNGSGLKSTIRPLF